MAVVPPPTILAVQSRATAPPPPPPDMWWYQHWHRAPALVEFAPALSVLRARPMTVGKINYVSSRLQDGEVRVTDNAWDGTFYWNSDGDSATFFFRYCENDLMVRSVWIATDSGMSWYGHDGCEKARIFRMPLDFMRLLDPRPYNIISPLPPRPPPMAHRATPQIPVPTPSHNVGHYYMAYDDDDGSTPAAETSSSSTLASAAATSMASTTNPYSASVTHPSGIDDILAAHSLGWAYVEHLN